MILIFKRYKGGGGGQSGHFFGWGASLETFSGEGGGGGAVKKHPVC